MTDQDAMPEKLIVVRRHNALWDFRGWDFSPSVSLEGRSVYYHESALRELVGALRTTLQVLEDSPPDTFGDNFEARWVKAVESGHALITKYGDVK